MSPIDVIEVQVRAGPALLETATLSPDNVLVGRWEGTGGQAVGLWSGPFESASLRHQIQRLPPSLGKRVLDGAVVSFQWGDESRAVYLPTDEPSWAPVFLGLASVRAAATTPVRTLSLALRASAGAPPEVVLLAAGAPVSLTHATLTVWTDGTLEGSSVPLTTGDAPEVVSGARTLEVGGGPGTLRACVNGEMPERFEVCAMLAAPR
jgi:hypothetical protein